MKIISVFNNKGGVGKSTYTYHLAHLLERSGKAVLLVDLDSCLVSCDHVPRRSMALFRAKAVLDEIIAGFLPRSSALRSPPPYRA